MADQGKWFKLWCSADDDPDLANLSLEDFARWCKFGMYVKLHGSEGTLEVKRPAYALQQKFRVTSCQEVCEVLERFPHCNTVSSETSLTVTLSNWLKYQGDFSSDRVRKFRQMKRSKRRGDEKRREENKTRVVTPPTPANGSVGFDSFWALYPKKKSKGQAERAWKSLKPDNTLVATMLAALEVQKASSDWLKESGRFIPNPATWLNGKRWLDEVNNAENKAVFSEVGERTRQNIRRAFSSGSSE